MRSTCKKYFALAGLLPAVLMACLAIPASAQSAAEANPAHGFMQPYDSAHEVIVTGTVQEVITKHSVGSPAGMHLLVNGSEGIVDAHVGPFLSKYVQEALHTGLPIQIVGAMETVHGKQFLLARQLIFGGRMVTVRSQNGFLVRGIRTPKANGGAQ
ncbi:MAG TPA: hypothetical protein VGS78_15900 [Candidatus Sulfotelmatobacter sp.]|nr:hypothetical protein [Candidatus Sulfotelmatobacter sp.]